MRGQQRDAKAFSCVCLMGWRVTVFSFRCDGRTYSVGPGGGALVSGDHALSRFELRVCSRSEPWATIQGVGFRTQLLFQVCLHFGSQYVGPLCHAHLHASAPGHQCLPIGGRGGRARAYCSSLKSTGSSSPRHGGEDAVGQTRLLRWVRSLTSSVTLGGQIPHRLRVKLWAVCSGSCRRAPAEMQHEGTEGARQVVQWTSISVELWRWALSKAAVRSTMGMSQRMSVIRRHSCASRSSVVGAPSSSKEVAARSFNDPQQWSPQSWSNWQSQTKASFVFDSCSC